MRPLGVSVSSVNIQEISLCFSLSLIFFRVDVDVAYLLNQYEFCMCVEVMVFVWKMTACRYSIWFPYIFLVVVESDNKLSTYIIEVQSNNTPSTDLFCKLTASFQYLQRNSYHPAPVTTSLPKCQFTRIRRICSYIKNYD